MNVSHSYLINIQAGENLTALDWAYIKISDGRAYKADRTDPAKRAMLLITTTTTLGDFTQGYAAGIASNWGTTLTPGTIYYLSSTAGAMTSTKQTSGNYQTLGIALSASELKLEIGPLVIQPLTVVETIDFAGVDEDGGTSSEIVSVPGAVVGDAVVLVVPFGLIEGRVEWYAYVSDADEVTIQIINNKPSAVDYESNDFTIKVFKNDI